MSAQNAASLTWLVLLLTVFVGNIIIIFFECICWVNHWICNFSFFFFFFFFKQQNYKFKGCLKLKSKIKRRRSRRRRRVIVYCVSCLYFTSSVRLSVSQFITSVTEYARFFFKNISCYLWWFFFFFSVFFIFIFIMKDDKCFLIYFYFYMNASVFFF